MKNYQKEDEPQYENTDADSLGVMFSELIQQVVGGSISSSGGNRKIDSDPSLEQLLCEGVIHDIKNE